MQVDTPLNQKESYFLGDPLPHQMAMAVTDQNICSDWPCLILFLGVQVGLCFLAAYSFSNGNPQLIIQPFNSASLQCGISTLKDYPYLLPLNSINYCSTSCPLTTDQSPTCALVSTNPVSCSSVGTLQNTSLVVRTCIGQNRSIVDQVSVFEGYAVDLVGSWPLILVSAGWSLILSLLTILLLRCCGGCIIASLLTLYELALVGLGLALFYSQNRTDLLLALSILSWIIAGLSLLIFICLFNKIRVAMRILEMASQYFAQECCIIMLPIATFVIHLAVVSLWVATVIYMFSTGEVLSSCSSPFDCVQWNQTLRNSLVFMFIVLFWDFEMVTCIGQFILASSVGYWFFNHIQPQEVKHPICKSIGRSFLHMGSLALASLLLLIILFINFFLEILRLVAKEKAEISGTSNCCARCCCGCIISCIKCFQNFLRFIDQSAILMMGITGQSFCKSAHSVFYMFERSKTMFVLTTGSCHMIMVVGRLLIACLSALFSYLLLTKVTFFSQQIYGAFFPTLLFWVVGYVVASNFLDLFGVCAETILVLFCLEQDALKESRACPKDLQQFFIEFRK